MSKIQTFLFNKDKFDRIKRYRFGRDWPAVYIIESGNEMYIGESISVYNRSKQHYDLPERRRLKNIHIIADKEYNKSATLDIESWLIQYIAAEGSIQLQNGNAGLKNHNYYDRAKYKAKFESIWKELKAKSIVHKDLLEIKNSDLFKYSPYKSLSEDQAIFIDKLFHDIEEDKSKTYIVHGKPGTGKTVLATYLMKYLNEHEKTKKLKIGLVVPMTSLRKTIKAVFKGIPGLKANMIIGPGDVVKDKYDLIIVDESHRLKQRRNIVNYASFDATNRSLGLNNDGTELDWIMMSSKRQIFFYDKDQSIKPTDINPDKFATLDATHYDLTTQLRVQAGDEYIKFIEDIFDMREVRNSEFKDYDFKLYDDIREMVQGIKDKDAKHGLCRVVAGYAWKWATNPNIQNPGEYDIEIDGFRLKWNSVGQDWVNSSNALNEVGCIHTVQGYDLNYVGVIIGPELSYDPNSKKLVINRDNYYDVNGHRGITDPEELERYIINIYKTLLTRGIKGTYIYVVDDRLRAYFKTLTSNMPIVSPVPVSIKSPIVVDMVMIPLVGTAPCGEPVFGQENIEEKIPVDRMKIRPGYDYFILRAEGDSMNLAGIQGGDLVLCRQQLKADTGDRVVALLGEDITIKMYDKKDGRRILLPKSTNAKHNPIIPDAGDSVLGIVQEVLLETEY
jgi:DUF2075 family protein/DNA replication protein DnaC